MASKKARYYNLKEGNKNANGIVIKVCPNAPLEKRLSEITGASFKSKLIYYNEIDYPRENIKYLLDITGNRVRKKTITVAIDSKGDLCITKLNLRSRKEPYLEEISSQKAKSIKEDAENWRLQRGYFDASLD